MTADGPSRTWRKGQAGSRAGGPHCALCPSHRRPTRLGGDNRSGQPSRAVSLSPAATSEQDGAQGVALTAPDPGLVCTGQLTAGGEQAARHGGQASRRQRQGAGHGDKLSWEPRQSRRGVQTRGCGRWAWAQGKRPLLRHGRRGQGGPGSGGIRASAGDSGNASNFIAFKNMTLFKDRHCPTMCVLTESCFISVPLTSRRTLPRRTKSRETQEKWRKKVVTSQRCPTSPRAIGIGQAGLPHRRLADQQPGLWDAK